jgi:hypothetical protein
VVADHDIDETKSPERIAAHHAIWSVEREFDITEGSGRIADRDDDSKLTAD